MDSCIFCQQILEENESVVTLTSKGCEGITEACKRRGDQIHTEPGQRVHKHCRRVYCNSNAISACTRKRKLDHNASTSDQCVLRSAEPSFNYKEHCLFCGKPDTYNHRRAIKGHRLKQVRTGEFQTEIERLCDTRRDKWSERVKGRLNSINDLFAADAVYHQVCSVSFRTNKSIPSQFATEEYPQAKRGRPQDMSQREAFLKVIAYLQENDDEQITINDLIEKMKQYLLDSCSDCTPYHFTYMKDQLKNHFGNELVITEVSGKSSIVALKATAATILHSFYRNSKLEDCDADKLRIIKTAAKLIKSDIQAVNQTKESYTSCNELSSVEEALLFLPDSLQLMLSTLFTSKGEEVKLASIGQSIMQATRPRGILAPLQVGLGVQLHHHFASKFLIDSLNKHGFCCSYSEVIKFERNATVAQRTDIPGFSGHFVQYIIADNVDHNIRTIDGMNTFHGMGMIATTTPATANNRCVPRITVSAEDISAVGTINILPFMPTTNGMQSLSYSEIHDFQEEDSSILDELWKISLSVRSPRPGWSGMMQMVYKGNHPGESSILFLPMIDMDPGNMSCVYSTLHFISQHASRYQVTPVITFDQPLWWKALQVIQSQPGESTLHSVVLRLGGFHTQMSFIGSIGHLMAGSGLQELLETVYANNTVTHMLNGKAVQRAIRGLFLVDSALNAMLVSKEFNVIPPCMANVANKDDDAGHESSSELSERLQLSSEQQNSILSTSEFPQPDLEVVRDLFDDLLAGTETVDDTCRSEVLARVIERLSKAKKSMQNLRTANLWLQFMKMMEILRKFIKGERMGIWKMHIQAMYEMLPYLAASGHNLYTKSIHIYLQQMSKLQETSPEVFRHFSQGLHVVRRSNRFWAGLSPDLVIEQVLMRSMKTSGGLTRGRGMTETQRLIWLLSHPLCAEVNNAMQQLTGINYNTSEQHKDLTKARQNKDMSDTCELLEFLESRNPFSDNCCLRSIASGINADSKVNVDRAKCIGDSILKSMVGKKVFEHTFRKKDQAITLAASAVQVNNETIQIDSQLLFQRLVSVGIRTEQQLCNIFQYELCSYPPALFEAKHVLRPANKPALADAIWGLQPSEGIGPTGQRQYILDGGSLLHRIPWQRGTTYNDICKQYTNYVTKHYGHAIIIFDGYLQELSTKDGAHQHRTGGRTGLTVDFTKDMVMKIKKEEFLSNKTNKQKFIMLLSDCLKQVGCDIRHAVGDADVLIVQTAIQSAMKCQTILIGEDTDLIVLLCFHVTNSCYDIFFQSEKRRGTKRNPRCWNIKYVQTILGRNACTNLLFAHAILGCDTTSRVFSLGKGLALKYIHSDSYFTKQAVVFLDENATEDNIIKAGEAALVCLYKGTTGETLDDLRLQRFHQKVATSTSFVKPEHLPPTSSAVKYHSLRVFHQVQVWKGIANLCPLRFGWIEMEGKLLPIQTDRDVAPKGLLEVIRCNCKMGCETMRCSCRKAGLECSTGCGECRGICANMSSVVVSDDNDV